MKIYGFKAKDINGKQRNMSEFKGKVLLIVNTASKCGLTPQFEGLEALYQKYKDKGLVILGFPCNQFGNQDPGNGEEILNFCQINYGVTFPMFEKIDVNGPNAHPIYKYLKKEKGGFLSSAIKWNFAKFLIDRKGNVVDRFSPTIKPEDLEKYIENLL